MTPGHHEGKSRPKFGSVLNANGLHTSLGICPPLTGEHLYNEACFGGVEVASSPNVPVFI